MADPDSLRQPIPAGKVRDAVRCRILVVEDEYIVAFDICDELVSLGAEVVGPAGTVDQAIMLARAAEPLHGAVLDVNVNGVKVFPVADLLASRGIPFVFATGYDRSVLPPNHADRLRIEKPMRGGDLARALQEICADLFETS